MIFSWHSLHWKKHEEPTTNTISITFSINNRNDSWIDLVTLTQIDPSSTEIVQLVIVDASCEWNSTTNHITEYFESTFDEMKWIELILWKKILSNNMFTQYVVVYFTSAWYFSYWMVYCLLFLLRAKIAKNVWVTQLLWSFSK